MAPEAHPAAEPDLQLARLAVEAAPEDREPQRLGAGVAAGAQRALGERAGHLGDALRSLDPALGDIADDVAAPALRDAPVDVAAAEGEPLRRRLDDRELRRARERRHGLARGDLGAQAGAERRTGHSRDRLADGQEAAVDGEVAAVGVDVLPEAVDAALPDDLGSGLPPGITLNSAG